MGIKGFFSFEIIINVLVRAFRFIWISMLWAYGHYIYFNFFSAGIYPVWLGRLIHLLREAQWHWPPFCFHSQLYKIDTRAAYQKTRVPLNRDIFSRRKILIVLGLLHLKMEVTVSEPCGVISAGTVYRLQNQMSTDVRFWRLNSIPALKELKIHNGGRPIT